MNRIQAAEIVANNWCIWRRLPRLARLARTIYPVFAAKSEAEAALFGVGPEHGL